MGRRVSWIRNQRLIIVSECFTVTMIDVEESGLFRSCTWLSRESLRFVSCLTMKWP